jgi:hypothetical protein
MSSSHNQNIGSPISNQAYNVISALHAKLEGLEVYQRYQQDGQRQLWHQLSQQDQEAVALLAQELERLIQEGQFHVETPGQTG